MNVWEVCEGCESCYCCGRSEGELSSQFARSLSCCFRKERSAMGSGESTSTTPTPRHYHGLHHRSRVDHERDCEVDELGIGAKTETAGAGCCPSGKYKKFGGPFTQRECQGIGSLADHVLEPKRSTQRASKIVCAVWLKKDSKNSELKVIKAFGDDMFFSTRCRLATSLAIDSTVVNRCVNSAVLIALPYVKHHGLNITVLTALCLNYNCRLFVNRTFNDGC